eukprot:scaffold124794_cov58-Attheya_sp.AAC.2
MKLVWLLCLLPLCSSRAGREGKNNDQTPHGLYKGTMCRPRGLSLPGGVVADSLHNQKQPRGATHSPMPCAATVRPASTWSPPPLFPLNNPMRAYYE